MNQLLLFVFMFLLLGLPMRNALANDTSGTTKTNRTFDDYAIIKLSKQPEFNYDSDPSMRLGITDLLSYFFRKYVRLKERQAKVFSKAITYSLIVFSALLLLKGLLGIKFDGLIFKQPALMNEDGEIVEITNSEQIDKLLAKAIETQHWKSAIRLLYIMALRNLAEKNQIVWAEEKTNFDYYYELKTPMLKQPFKEFTRVFEDVWYGNKEADKKRFENAEERYTQLVSLIKAGPQG